MINFTRLVRPLEWTCGNSAYHAFDVLDGQTVYAESHEDMARIDADRAKRVMLALNLDHIADAKKMVADAAVKAALERAADACTNIIQNIEILKADGETYQPPWVQKIARGLVDIARQDILALIPKGDNHE